MKNKDISIRNKKNFRLPHIIKKYRPSENYGYISQLNHSFLYFEHFKNELTKTKVSLDDLDLAEIYLWMGMARNNLNLLERMNDRSFAKQVNIDGKYNFIGLREKAYYFFGLVYNLETKFVDEPDVLEELYLKELRGNIYAKIDEFRKLLEKYKGKNYVEWSAIEADGKGGIQEGLKDFCKERDWLEYILLELRYSYLKHGANIESAKMFHDLAADVSKKLFEIDNLFKIFFENRNLNKIPILYENPEFWWWKKIYDFQSEHKDYDKFPLYNADTAIYEESRLDLA